MCDNCITWEKRWDELKLQMKKGPSPVIYCHNVEFVMKWIENKFLIPKVKCDLCGTDLENYEHIYSISGTDIICIRCKENPDWKFGKNEKEKSSD